VRLDHCDAVDPTLWPVDGEDRRAACVRVLPDDGRSLVAVTSEGRESA
jgi:hypothetical protein